MSLVVRNEGARLLGLVPATQVQIAGRCGVTQGLVSKWRASAKRPGDGCRDVLEAEYGIPRDAWDRAAAVAPACTAAAA